MPFNEALAQRIRRLLKDERAVSEKRMFGGLAFMVNGHMCCGIVGTDLVVRVGTEKHEEALKCAGARPMDFTGKSMKGFVYVAPAGYRSSGDLRRWIRRGLEFVTALPPK